MSQEEITTKAEEILKDNPYFELLSVDAVNHKPHPYVIGPKHIEYSPGVYLDVDAAERKGAHCMHGHCRIPAKDHTFDTAVFLKLKQDVPNKQAALILTQLKNAFIKEGTTDQYWIAGFAFVNGSEGFKILDAEEG